MLRISIVKVRQFLISIWHSLKTPPAEKVVEDKLGGVPEPQIKRAEPNPANRSFTYMVS
jgi:hypothetical protein